VVSGTEIKRESFKQQQIASRCNLREEKSKSSQRRKGKKQGYIKISDGRKGES